MNKSKIFLTLGVWVAILPYLGFPFAIKNILFTLTGLILIYLAYIIYRESKISNKQNKTFDSFSENNRVVLKDEKLKSEENFLEEVN